MKPLVLTSMSGFHFTVSNYVEATIPFSFRFVWGPLPSPDELAAYLGPRSEEQKRGRHWSDFVDWSLGRVAPGASKHSGLIEFCGHYETIELWFDPDPGDQLQLIWLLDHFRSDPEIAPKLILRLVDRDLEELSREWFSEFEMPAADVTEAEFETACMTWFGYREPTPEACFGLLKEDLGALPMLKPALRDLLAELPSASTGLGATEMRMLELIARGYEQTSAFFQFSDIRQTRIFSEWEHGYLLDGLAFGPRPAVAGLDEELPTVARENLGARHPLYLRSRLSLTKFGEAVVAHKEDFSRHNPIDRWWGGTHLTNDRLWRYDPVLMRP